MREKRNFPLNNPFKERKPNTTGSIDPGVDEKVKGVSKGGEGKTRMTPEEMLQEYQEMCRRNERDKPVIYMLLRCRQCGKEQQIVFYWWYPPKMHTCTGCGEKQPTQGYVIIAHANGPLG